MEDRFKFRAWDKKKLIYFDFTTIYGYEGEVSGVILPDTSTVLTYNEDQKMVGLNLNLKITSCTGHKDKNGKLIYEGDIVRCIFYDNKPEVTIIEWDKLAAGFTIAGYSMNIHGLHDVEILGNIYENPELKVN